ncbi:MAG: putative O-methyltransferase YrrM [Planctomycetota bacterium]|jgi:predicted O-methyltransferase YrrM
MLAYLRNSALLRESDELRALRLETAPMEDAEMQISVEQGRLMAFLVASMGAKRAIEVGTFTGYSALAVAEVLPAGGLLVACDTSEAWTSIGRPHWERANVADRIDLRIGPALETLDALLADGQGGSFDFAFIDADKEPYPDYFERCLKLLRVGGTVAFDNMFWGGSVFDDSRTEGAAPILRQLNKDIAADTRVEPVLVPIGDGLLLARKLG